MNPLKPSEALPSFLAGIAESYGSCTAITGGDEDPAYAQHFEHSTSVAGELLLSGVGKGIRVGLLYGNDPRSLISAGTSAGSSRRFHSDVVGRVHLKPGAAHSVY